MTSTIFDLWVNNADNFPALIEKSNEAHSPIAIALIKLNQFKGNLEEYNQSEARQTAQNIFKGDQKYESNLFTLFLVTWAKTALEALNLIEAEMILKKVNKGGEISTILKAFIIITNGVLKSFRGDKFAGELSIDQCIKILPLESSHHQSVLKSKMAFLSSMGRFKEIEKSNYDFTALIDSTNKAVIDSRYGNYVQTFQADKLRQLKKQFEKDDDPSNPIFELKKFERNITFISNCFSPDYKQYDINNPDLLFRKRFIAATSYLYDREPLIALDWAKKIINDNPPVIYKNNLFSYILIRAELANKNTTAAKNLLNKKREGGDSHYLDDLFSARVESLNKNKAKAKKLFKNAFEHCLYYDALNRLFFELDVACELSNREKIEWIQFCADCKPKVFKTHLVSINKEEKLQNIVGQSKPIIKLKKIIKKFADANSTILILGETGVGKEEVAKSLHKNSSRSAHPYLTINCGAIAESLLHSELFGHHKGSYTGAITDHKGIFEAAGKGTVLLDEIGEISQQVQVSLLRILESNEIKPIGSSKTKKIHCQIIAATNRNLAGLVKKGTFRDDLYYRLNRLEIQVPPLRERSYDIITLAKYFFAYNRPDKKQVHFSKELQEAMLQYTWPGNIRQLKNEIENLRLQYSEKIIYELDDFDLVNGKSQKKPNRNTAPKVAAATINKMEAIIEHVILHEKTPLRRREKVKELFLSKKTLTRGEIVKTLNVAPGTITNDLKVLINESFIIKIKPSASTRSHYFQLNK